MFLEFTWRENLERGSNGRQEKAKGFLKVVVEIYVRKMSRIYRKWKEKIQNDKIIIKSNKK